MLKSLLGISMPRTLLPGIGASMRIVRAARAMARSSVRASMRLTLISGEGSTSYCVTTGPAFQATTRAGMPKLASLAAMIAALRSWSMPLSPIRGAMLSSSASGGRLYSGRGFSAVATEPAGFNCAVASRPVRGPRIDAPSRTDVPSRPVESPDGAGRAAPLSRSGPSRSDASSRARLPCPTCGAKVSEVGPGLGLATGIVGVRSSPKRRPSTGAASFAPFSRRSGRTGADADVDAAGGTTSGAGLNSLAIARENSIPSGATTAGSDMSRASRMPALMKTPRIATVPGTVTRGDMKWASFSSTLSAESAAPPVPISPVDLHPPDVVTFPFRK